MKFLNIIDGLVSDNPAPFLALLLCCFPFYILEAMVERWKQVLTISAEFCVVATFFEDVIRTCYQWGDCSEYLAYEWGCGYVVGSSFCLMNAFGQLAACLLMLRGVRIRFAVGLLFGIIMMQSIAYKVFGDIQLLARFLAQFVGLIFLQYELRRRKTRSSSEHDDHKVNMQLTCSFFFLLMYLTLLAFELSFLKVISAFVGYTLMSIVILLPFTYKWIGLPTLLFVTVLKVYTNVLWVAPLWKFEKQFLKYDFIEIIVLAGWLLLLVICVCPDEEIDEDLVRAYERTFEELKQERKERRKPKRSSQVQSSQVYFLGEKVNTVHIGGFRSVLD